MLPWISTRSTDRDVSGTTSCKIASTSASLFALPVTKLSEGGIIGVGAAVFVCVSVKLVPKVVYVFIFVSFNFERERGRERIYNEWGLRRCESPVTVRVCRR